MTKRKARGIFLKGGYRAITAWGELVAINRIENLFLGTDMTFADNVDGIEITDEGFILKYGYDDEEYHIKVEYSLWDDIQYRKEQCEAQEEGLY